MRVLVVNAGSSTLKLSVLDGADAVLDARTVSLSGSGWDQAELEGVLGALPVPDAVGHRVVHGGRRYVGPVRLDDRVVADLEGLAVLAPLHQPKALAGIEAVSAVLPGVEGVACFDTAFHASLPEVARTYAVPREWRSRWGVRRYGFHGLSHAFVAERLGGVGDRLVSAHLGAGASLAAVREGVCVDTTMGFTPVEGLVMATRSGDVDPGALLWLQRYAGLGVDEVAEGLERGSGLLGLAGSGDMRQVLADEGRGVEEAVLAVGVYVHRLRARVAAMAASLSGLDVLAFTAGVGEGSAVVRSRVCAGLAFLGVEVDEGVNGSLRGEGEISAGDAPVRTFVVGAREDVQIARGVRAVLGG
ncbi:acetate/propionate family kinase [Nocardiopsis sp. HNM0947]|uniref:Acetate kinase n=1 Tax=Nocardiopsis coralli TaxID=2772213 RepID=A0ABR9P6I6_9ACTN|nr:acetate/propionate family kinase [Nocardiopsis coralli]MBE2999455.1 acetate/propionate family kinase [Nocardiopsis coralli]